MASRNGMHTQLSGFKKRSAHSTKWLDRKVEHTQLSARGSGVHTHLCGEIVRPNTLDWVAGESIAARSLVIVDVVLIPSVDVPLAVGRWNRWLLPGGWFSPTLVHRLGKPSGEVVLKKWVAFCLSFCVVS